MNLLNSAAPIPPVRRTWVEAIGMNTILGRFLFTAIILVISTVGIAWLAQGKVSNLNQANTHNLTQRVNASHSLRILHNLLWQTETHFQSYMLNPSTEEQHTVLKHVIDIEVVLQRLQQEDWVTGKLRIPGLIEQLDKDSKHLHQLLESIMVMRADPLKVFPNITIMVNTLNPLNMEFSSTIAGAINETNNIKTTLEEQQIVRLFNEVRYLWSQRISFFRMFSAARVGVYNATIESSLSSHVDDIETFNRQILAALNQLKQYDARGSLEFEQSVALNELFRIQKEWNKGYQQAKSIIMSSENWRLDTPVMRNKINPLFVKMWQALQEVTVEVEQRAADDIGSTTQIANQVTTYLWLLTIAVLIVALFGTLVFETQIRRPILRVIRAIKAEADGKANIVLPQSPIAETRDLIAAFANMREQIHTRQEHLQAILTYAAEAIITINEQGTIESFNPASESLFGYPPAEVIGKNVNILILPPNQEDNNLQICNFNFSYIINIDGRPREVIWQHKDGSEISIILHITEMYVGRRKLFLVMLSDNREHRAMLDGIQAREQRLRSILDNTAEGIVTFDEDGLIEHWNHAAEQIFGWNEAEIIGTSFLQLVSNEAINPDEHDQWPSRRLALQQYLVRETEVIGKNKNGSCFPLSLKVGRLTLDGRTKYTALIANITERKALMENLRKLAEHDSLTGLYNRAYFHAELERVVEKVKRNEHSPYAVLYIDLDNFKYINDTLGHTAGDKLLIEVAQLLNSRTRRSDLVARLGGDEFVVLLSAANPDVIQPIAESFRRHLADYAFHYDSRTVDIGCSIGVALINTETQSAGEVMSQADVACHFAKRAGRNRIHIFTAQDDGDVRTMSIDMGWSRRIKQALEHDHFVLALQPIVATKTRKSNLFEVLIRMKDADGSIIMPSGFLPTAERFGLAAEIDAWVVRHAIQHLAHIRRNGADIRYSINLSGQTITAAMITELIPSVLAQTKIDPAALIFEITETSAIADMSMAVTLLSQLRALGCRTALDDFGSGMSSFAYLRELPVDIVKIDGRFVKNLANSTVDQAMVRAMNDIAHALGKETIAEFVEHEIHYQVLCQLGVDYGQGYHLGKPALIDLLSNDIYQFGNSNPAASAG